MLAIIFLVPLTGRVPLSMRSVPCSIGWGIVTACAPESKNRAPTKQIAVCREADRYRAGKAALSLKKNSHNELVTPQFTNHTDNVQRLCSFCQEGILITAKKRR